MLGGESINLKTKQLDLSRCRKLQGDGVIFCLRSMPYIESLSLSLATRFDVTDNFNNSSLLAAVKHLNYMDISGCSRLGTSAISCLASTTLSWSNIRVLDFSGCSTLIGDEAAVSVAEHCHNLECVNVSGSKKLTTFGVAIIAFVCRSTLRCLITRGCESVRLTTLLYAHALACPVNDLRGWWEDGEDMSLIRRNLTGNSNDNYSFLSASYVKAFIDALLPLVDGPIHTNVRDESERLMGLCKEYEERWTNHYGWADRNDEHSLFGQLEKLDISDSFGFVSGPKLNRDLAVISWLNKGKLKEINMSGLYVSSNVVSALALASGSRLQCIEVSCFRGSELREPVPLTSLICFRGVRELDLSCCDDLVNNGTTFMEMELRSLKLDHLQSSMSGLLTFLSTTDRLLRLSIHGCSELKVSVLTNAKIQNPKLKLLELDVRDASMDVKLSTIRDAFPSLLKLNNRCTKVGTERIQQHQENYHWRIGSRERKCKGSKSKRKRGESLDVRHVVGSTSASLNCCSLQLTGFSKAQSTEQEMFGCATCHIEFGRFVCLSCSKNCHQALGHEVFSIGYGAGYCDCSILSNCMCIK